MNTEQEMSQVPGFLFVDHVAIAVKQGELDSQAKAYEMLGFREIHREEVHGKDQVREALDRVERGALRRHRLRTRPRRTP